MALKYYRYHLLNADRTWSATTICAVSRKRADAVMRANYPDHVAYHLQMIGSFKETAEKAQEATTVLAGIS